MAQQNPAPTPAAPTPSETTQTAVLVALGVDVVAGVFGTVLSPANAVSIMGFCTMIAVALLSLLQQAKAAIKADVVAVKVEEASVKAAAAAVKVEEVAVKADRAAVKVEEVKTALDSATSATQTQHDDTVAKLEALAKVSTATHTLVNSQHGIALSTVYEQALKIAHLTGDPADMVKADTARQKLAEHEAKQSVVDAQQGADAEKGA